MKKIIIISIALSTSLLSSTNFLTKKYIENKLSYSKCNTVAKRDLSLIYSETFFPLLQEKIKMKAEIISCPKTTFPFIENDLFFETINLIQNKDFLKAAEVIKKAKSKKSKEEKISKYIIDLKNILKKNKMDLKNDSVFFKERIHMISKVYFLMKNYKESLKFIDLFLKKQNSKIAEIEKSIIILNAAEDAYLSKNLREAMSFSETGVRFLSNKKELIFYEIFLKLKKIHWNAGTKLMLKYSDNGDIGRSIFIGEKLKVVNRIESENSPFNKKQKEDNNVTENSR